MAHNKNVAGRASVLLLAMLHSCAAFSYGLSPRFVPVAGEVEVQQRWALRQNSCKPLCPASFNVIAAGPKQGAMSLRPSVLGVATVRHLNVRRSSLRMSLADEDTSRMYEKVSEMEPSFLSFPKVRGETVAAKENSTVLPLFPLGAVVYTPFSEHRLNIFEPRYRAMYNDILFSGSRRFAVCTMHPEDGRFSEFATVFYLKDLKEVSEQTGDKVKFICDHEVIGRVKINTILNPSSWEKGDTYLKIEVDYQEDTQEDEAQIAKAQEDLAQEYRVLVNLQHEISEDVKFTKDSVEKFNTTVGKGFWSTIEMWQVFQQQRLIAKQAEMQRDFQAKLITYLTKEGGPKRLPEMVNIADLPEELQKEVRALQTRMADELEPMQKRDGFDLQILIEAKSHADRLRLMLGLVQNERRRLEAKKTLKSLFAM